MTLDDLTPGELEPQAGDFAVIRTNDWTGRLIRWWTRSQFNHAVWFVAPDQVVEAQPGGAVMTPWTHYAYRCSDAPDAEVVSSVGLWPLTAEQRRHALEVGLRCVGKPYGWLDILAIGLLQWGVSVRWIRRRVQRQDRLICSQLVDLCREQLGDHLFHDGRLPQDCTPGDLAHLLGRR